MLAIMVLFLTSAKLCDDLRLLWYRWSSSVCVVIRAVAICGLRLTTVSQGECLRAVLDLYLSNCGRRLLLFIRESY